MIGKRSLKVKGKNIVYFKVGGLGANSPNTGGQSSGANCPGGELSGYPNMIFNTLRLTLVETKENNKQLHQLHNIQPEKNNEQQDYKILTLLRPHKHYSTAVSGKKGNGYIT